MRTQSDQNNSTVLLYDSKGNIDRTLPNSAHLIKESIQELFTAQSHPNVCSLKTLFISWLDKKNSLFLQILLMALQIILQKDYNNKLFCVFIDNDGFPKVYNMMNHQGSSSSNIVDEILEKVLDTSRQADKNLNDASRVERQLELLKKDQQFQKKLKEQLQDLLQGQRSGNEHNKPPIQVQADDNPTPKSSKTNIDDASRERELQEQLKGDPENQNINQTHGDGNVMERNLNFKGAFSTIIDDAQYQQQVHQGHPQSGQPEDQFQDHERVNELSLQIATPKKNKLKPEPLQSYIMVLLGYIYQEYPYTEKTKKRQIINLEQINCLHPLTDENNILIQLFICCRVIIAALFDVAFEHIKVDLDSENFNFIFVNAQSEKIYFINQTHLDYYFKRQTMYKLNTRDLYTTQDALLDMSTINMKLVDQGRDFEPWVVSLNCIKQTPISYYNCLIQLSQWNLLEDACPQCGVERERDSWILDTVFSVLHSHLFKNKQKYGISVGDNIKFFFNNLKLYVQAIGEPIEFMTMKTFDDVYDPYESVSWVKRGYYVKKISIEDEEAYCNKQLDFDHGQHLHSLMEQALLVEVQEEQNLMGSKLQLEQKEAKKEAQNQIRSPNLVMEQTGIKLNYSQMLFVIQFNIIKMYSRISWRKKLTFGKTEKNALQKRNREFEPNIKKSATKFNRIYNFKHIKNQKKEGSKEGEHQVAIQVFRAVKCNESVLNMTRIIWINDDQ